MGKDTAEAAALRLGKETELNQGDGSVPQVNGNNGHKSLALAVRKFVAYLRDEKEQSPRGTYNKFENVMTFLKAHGVRGLVGKNDWPRYI